MTNGVEHCAGIAAAFQTYEYRALEASGARKPAGKLGGERSFARAARAADYRPRLAVQQAFECD